MSTSHPLSRFRKAKLSNFTLSKRQRKRHLYAHNASIENRKLKLNLNKARMLVAILRAQNCPKNNFYFHTVLKNFSLFSFFCNGRIKKWKMTSEERNDDSWMSFRMLFVNSMLVLTVHPNISMMITFDEVLRCENTHTNNAHVHALHI